MKMPLFIASAFLTLSATSHAAPPGGGLHGGSFRSGFVAHSTGPAFRMVLEFAGTSHFIMASHFIKTAVSFIAIIVSFFNSLVGLFIGIPTILTITPIWITDPITTINIGTIQPRLCNRNPLDPPSTMARLSS